MYKGAKECQGFISHFCMVDFTNVTLAFKDANSKLLDDVSVADVDAEKRIDCSLVQIWKLSFVIKLNFCSDFGHKVWSRFGS